jgi:2-oxoglutarate dehydrogenase E2 component (dihydrolipoamide succinyltransferase)
MKRFEVVMPRLGESIIEATVLKWNKNVGESIKADEILLEIATDKVDSEVPSPVSGVITEILFKENDVVKIGSLIAIISVEGDNTEEIKTSDENKLVDVEIPINETMVDIPFVKDIIQNKDENYTNSEKKVGNLDGGKFVSPLVKSIAKEENISNQELSLIVGSGLDGRITKSDIINYLERRNIDKTTLISNNNKQQPVEVSVKLENGDRIVELDRMRTLIADHMVMSKKVSPHVTSFVEVDMTKAVLWRNQNKELFQAKYGEKITFTPIFIDAVVKAIKDFPEINSIMEGKKWIIKNNVNIGMAAALPNGNLIVPVIKNADLLSLAGLTSKVNDLATRARVNKLSPDEINQGTFTITNLGSFGNLTGTPIINQPQVAILATGIITKKPVVVETDEGDVIAIRQMMILSLSYDHRVIDGFLGGSFLKRVGQYLETFTTEQ